MCPSWLSTRNLDSESKDAEVGEMIWLFHLPNHLTPLTHCYRSQVIYPFRSLCGLLMRPDGSRFEDISVVEPSAASRADIYASFRRVSRKKHSRRPLLAGPPGISMGGWVIRSRRFAAFPTSLTTAELSVLIVDGCVPGTSYEGCA